MTYAEAEKRYFAHARYLDKLWAEIWALDRAGVRYLDPRRLELAKRAIIGSQHLITLYDYLPPWQKMARSNETLRFDT